MVRPWRAQRNKYGHTHLYRGHIAHGVGDSVYQGEESCLQLRDRGKELHGLALQAQLEFELWETCGVVLPEEQQVVVDGAAEQVTQLVPQQRVHTLIVL